MVIRAVLFDLDNTLVDFIDIKKRATTAALDAMIRAGLPLEHKNGLKMLFEEYWEHGIENQKIFQIFLRKVIGRIDYKVLAAGIEAYRKEKEKRMKPYPGVRPVLKRLKKRYTLGIISDAPTLQVWLRLTELGLTGLFNLIITPAETKGKKPTGLPFKLAMRELGLRPNEIAMVGDWPSRDIEPARKLGIVTVLARYGQTEKEKCSPDFAIRSFRELPTVLKSA